MSTRSSILAIGLPESGKTTFLAALYTVLESNEVVSVLKLQNLGDSAEYLNTLRQHWSQCQKVPRNTVGSHEHVYFKLTDIAETKVTDLAFPDLSGEAYREQWYDRIATLEYDEMAKQASGILLFIHPDAVVEPLTINDVQKLASVLVPETDDGDAIDADEPANSSASPDGGEVEAKDDPAFPEWDPAASPTQVQLVEALQFATRHGSVKRIGVVVSAWDVLGTKAPLPEKWLKQRLPLLDQYLRANVRHFSSRVFGVSATGGDLKTERGRLLETDRCLRIRVVGDGIGNEHDVSEPVAWLIA